MIACTDIWCMCFKVSQILTSKISKPAISSTPMKCCLFCLVSRVSLHFLTSHLNSLSNMPLQMAPTELVTWSLLRPWVTNSLPTLMRGFSKFLYKSVTSQPRSLATRSPSCGWGNICWVRTSSFRGFDWTYDHAVSFSLLFATSLLELHATHVHDGGGDLVDVILLFLGETQNVEGIL